MLDGDPQTHCVTRAALDRIVRPGLIRFAGGTGRGGHIPGAVNLNWLDTVDQQRNLRLRGQQELRQRLDDLGVRPTHEVIAYCHTHHRSAHSYVMLKWLGFDRLRGYPGAWSDWGNHPETPVERSMAAFNPAGV